MTRFWDEFAHDPRDPALAPLRASDTDREIVRQALATAFAEGRLDREEYDERSSVVLTARTLGDLPPLVGDLVPVVATPAATGGDLVHASPADLRARAEQEWLTERRNAIFGFIGPTVICWAIWLATNLGSADYTFPWPLIVTAVTGLNAARTLSGRDEIVAKEVRRLEKKQTKARAALEQKKPDDRDDTA